MVNCARAVDVSQAGITAPVFSSRVGINDFPAFSRQAAESNRRSVRGSVARCRQTEMMPEARLAGWLGRTRRAGLRPRGAAGRPGRPPSSTFRPKTPCVRSMTYPTPWPYILSNPPSTGFRRRFTHQSLADCTASHSPPPPGAPPSRCKSCPAQTPMPYRRARAGHHGAIPEANCHSERSCENPGRLPNPAPAAWHPDRSDSPPGRDGGRGWPAGTWSPSRWGVNAGLTRNRIAEVLFRADPDPVGLAPIHVPLPGHRITVPAENRRPPGRRTRGRRGHCPPSSQVHHLHDQTAVAPGFPSASPARFEPYPGRPSTGAYCKLGYFRWPLGSMA